MLVPMPPLCAPRLALPPPVSLMPRLLPVLLRPRVPEGERAPDAEREPAPDRVPVLEAVVAKPAVSSIAEPLPFDPILAFHSPITSNIAGH